MFGWGGLLGLRCSVEPGMRVQEMPDQVGHDAGCGERDGEREPESGVGGGLRAAWPPVASGAGGAHKRSEVGGIAPEGRTDPKAPGLEDGGGRIL